MSCRYIIQATIGLTVLQIGLQGLYTVERITHPTSKVPVLTGVINCCHISSAISIYVASIASIYGQEQEENVKMFCQWAVFPQALIVFLCLQGYTVNLIAHSKDIQSLESQLHQQNHRRNQQVNQDQLDCDQLIQKARSKAVCRLISMEGGLVAFSIVDGIFSKVSLYSLNGPITSLLCGLSTFYLASISIAYFT
uniref:ARAD1A12166p n=1 Tax=Blastobotrys adeninivorans TaxID=409370 RepID=A0A060T3U3_BLAAD